MEMTPDEFYGMDIGDFILKFRGFIDGATDQKRDLRRHAYLILSAWCEKLPSAYKIWPLYGDEELRKEIKEHTDKITLETLKMHREGGFKYVDEIVNGRRIVVQKPLLN